VWLLSSIAENSAFVATHQKAPYALPSKPQEVDGTSLMMNRTLWQLD
jgi:hypothetical protein